ncbi:hypothetical protein LABALGNA3A7_15880 [Dellaglioa algida]|nr:hypothetical protein LABALGNA3A7_15880 [Dellaglioa algida]
MKKNLFLIAALVLGATAAVSTNVSADATSSNGKGTATLNIKAGTLNLTGAPSFSFEKTMDNALVETGAAIDSKDADQTLKISDFTGTDAGWHVTGQLAAFSNANVTSLNLKMGGINATVDNTKNEITSTAAVLTAGGAAATIASAVKSGAGDTTFLYAEKSATLNLGKTTKAVKDAQADLTWTATQGNASGALFN